MGARQKLCRINFIHLIIAGLILGACAPGTEQPAAEPDASGGPASAGFSIEGLGELNAALEQLVEDRRVAGLVTMLARHGEIVQTGTFGYQEIEAQVPMETDTIFRIYSMTKPVTGTAMMILHERDLWDLDDPVSMHIPEFEGLQVAVEDEGVEIQRVPQDHPMTMRELMTHTGGLTYGFFSESAVDTMYIEANVLDPNSSLETMIDKLADLPLRQQPGSLWHYSVSVDVQAYLVEKLSGQSFPEFLSEHIFQPLGMVDTAFFVPPEKSDRLATTVYDYGPEGELVRGAEIAPGASLEGDYSALPGLPSGGGGLVSTASDYMRFAQMLLNGGELDGVRILSPESVELMRSHQAPTTESAPGPVALGPGTGFGMDVAVTLDPAAAGSPVGEGTYWWAGAAGTWFWIDPANDLVFIAMAQHNYFDIADLVPLTQQWVYDALVNPER